MSEKQLFPEKITLVNETVLTIDWSDGHASVYFADHLRSHCPCAVCEKQRDAIQASKVTFTEWHPIGRYALGFTFSDGHNLGMYTYQQLFDLCQCDACRKDVVRIRGPLR